MTTTGTTHDVPDSTVRVYEPDLTSDHTQRHPRPRGSQYVEGICPGPGLTTVHTDTVDPADSWTGGNGRRASSLLGRPLMAEGEEGKGQREVRRVEVRGVVTVK